MRESADLARLPSDRSRKWEIPDQTFPYHFGALIGPSPEALWCIFPFQLYCLKDFLRPRLQLVD